MVSQTLQFDDDWSQPRNHVQIGLTPKPRISVGEFFGHLGPILVWILGAELVFSDRVQRTASKVVQHPERLDMEITALLFARENLDGTVCLFVKGLDNPASAVLCGVCRVKYPHVSLVNKQKVNQVVQGLACPLFPPVEIFCICVVKETGIMTGSLVDGWAWNRIVAGFCIFLASCVAHVENLVAGSPTQIMASFNDSLPLSPLDERMFVWLLSEPWLFTNCKSVVWPGIEMADVKAEDEGTRDIISGEFSFDEARELIAVWAPITESPLPVIFFNKEQEI
ncbi:hypothetical protein OGAPHI_002437 [Ogataea philodendri]|uniref:Uncharacterized protein n=1 Tax=Ogataea philodendri TaxID=1378263 RepID=A0A9P8PAN7_9ASCO|nr:uncharacterized protein OGAPHI_002437 [Ogataea philodendri]KAH3668683.1 hypothetical protein OGAPHI_002437 [Ogataea philodendri]